MNDLFRDRVCVLALRSRYFWGTLRARLLIRNFGNNNLIGSNVSILQPSNIRIGDNVEIRSFTCLDARSYEANAISISNNARIKENVALIAYAGSIAIGDGVLLGRNTTLFGHGGITIGDATMVSPHCIFVASNHFFSLNGTDFQTQGFSKEPIYVGRNCWIGASCTILGGSVIGDNVVVAAGAVVNSVLESGFIYGGIPAIQIRRINREEMTEHTRYFKTWDAFSML